MCSFQKVTHMTVPSSPCEPPATLRHQCCPWSWPDSAWLQTPRSWPWPAGWIPPYASAPNWIYRAKIKLAIRIHFTVISKIQKGFIFKEIDVFGPKLYSITLLSNAILIVLITFSYSFIVSICWHLNRLTCCKSLKQGRPIFLHSKSWHYVVT